MGRLHVLSGGCAVVLSFTLIGTVVAGPINPQVFKKKFDDAKKEAEVIADVRVLSAVCTETAGEGKAKSVVLQLSLQILESEKGPVKKNDVLVVSHKVNLPGGFGPLAYGYMAALRQFPFTPGVKGSVALRWDKERRNYVAIAGWVPEPNHAAIPKEAGQALAANEMTRLKSGINRDEVIKLLGTPQKEMPEPGSGNFSLTYDQLDLRFASDRLEAVAFRLKKQ